MPTDLQVCAIGKSFAGEPVVADVSFTVREGEVVSILGPSGCGKTTRRCAPGRRAAGRRAQGAATALATARVTR